MVACALVMPVWLVINFEIEVYLLPRQGKLPVYLNGII